MAPERGLTSWPAEGIPYAERLFMRAHRVFFRGGELAPGVFRDHGDGMSVDWERYSSPEETRLRAREPEDNAVVQMVTGEVRAIPPLTVEHRPIRENRAHSEVLGTKDPEVRVKLRRICRIVIPCSPR